MIRIFHNCKLLWPEQLSLEKQRCCRRRSTSEMRRCVSSSSCCHSQRDVNSSIFWAQLTTKGTLWKQTPRLSLPSSPRLTGWRCHNWELIAEKQHSTIADRVLWTKQMDTLIDMSTLFRRFSVSSAARVGIINDLAVRGGQMRQPWRKSCD